MKLADNVAMPQKGGYVFGIHDTETKCTMMLN